MAWSKVCESPMDTLLPWHQAGDAKPGAGDGWGDPVAARQWLDSNLIGDADASLGRLTLHGLADGTDLSRLDDSQIKQQLAAALEQGRLRAAAGPALLLRPVGQGLLPPPAAPPAAPVSSPRPAAPAAAAAPPPAIESTFGSDVDVEAMVAVLRAAAQDGVPFCEECARAKAKRQMAEAAA